MQSLKSEEAVLSVRKVFLKMHTSLSVLHLLTLQGLNSDPPPRGSTSVMRLLPYNVRFQAKVGRRGGGKDYTKGQEALDSGPSSAANPQAVSPLLTAKLDLDGFSMFPLFYPGIDSTSG